MRSMAPATIPPLRYELLELRSSDPVVQQRLEAAYGCWHSVWSETYRELDGLQWLAGDHFTRQDEVGAIFCGDACVGLTTYRFVDFTRPWIHGDSYFQIWPETAMHALALEGNRICIGSHLTILPRWRGRIVGVSLKRVLLGLAVKRFLASDADTMSGILRNDRGMNDVGYELGATAFSRQLTLHGVAVDVVGFYRSRAKSLNPDDDGQAVERLWRECRKEVRDEEGVA